MSAEIAHFFQDRNESVARTIDWTPDLNGSTISAVTWVLETGITQDAVTNTTTTATIRISAASAQVGRTYTVTCRVTSAAAEVVEAHFLLTIED